MEIPQIPTQPETGRDELIRRFRSLLAMGVTPEALQTALNLAVLLMVVEEQAAAEEAPVGSFSLAVARQEALLRQLGLTPDAPSPEEPCDA